MIDVPEGLTQRHGRWVLPVAGGEVAQVRIDFAFGLVIETYDERRASVSVRINTRLDFGHDGATTSIDPEQTSDLASLITLHKATVAEGYVVKDGHLVLRFSDGREIRVAPDDQYEAFHITGELPPIVRRFELISVPGGGVARL